ncbi:phage ATP-dependent endopeptidase [Weissella oryzae SG25]|uniref:ATP-dependent Clp protease proteolytic subunit n=1 Tax=Weissella oryzae (strain DSM 25784 / JCM 18191 / LMG 30913 / SG25) TaxID=1329250 RepID=A0A069CVZ0_WEIOS|nr:head maturation protease, ClpP-related [Weissella oryzae]GAK31965.1 phage ATP-dependent endopeptidase [Weissella oryzae SG25]
MSNIINLTGPVMGDEQGWIYDWLGLNAIHPSKIHDLLNEANDDEIVVNLSSGGGEVVAASEIYTALRQSDKHVVINVTGMAASAASVIAMAGDEINISPTAQIMIHQASISIQGNKDDLEKISGLLDKTDKSIADAYVQRTGLPVEDVLKMMSDETFLTAKDAVDYHFADSIMFVEDSKSKVTNSVNDGMLPDAVVNKIGTMIVQTKQETLNNEDTSRLDIKSKAAILLQGEI